MDRVIIFDTTLRDGEQSPGFSMNTMEKLEMARQLARLRVDVIEAGFPISSDEDFEATREVARQVGTLDGAPSICGLSRVGLGANGLHPAPVAGRDDRGRLDVADLCQFCRHRWPGR